MNQKDNWDAHWSRLSAAASENPAQKYRFRLVCDEVRLQSKSSSVIRIVDLGCGNGDLLAELNLNFENTNLVGIEPSHSGWSISSQKNLQSTVIKSDILKDNLADQVLKLADIVICSEVLEHLDDPGRLISTLSTKLNGGTILLVTVPGGPRSKFDRHIGHRKHFDRKSLGNLLKENGFDQVVVKRAGFPGQNIYKVTTILLGKSLINMSENFEASSRTAVISRIFYWMMQRSFKDSVFGWQLLSISTRPVD